MPRIAPPPSAQTVLRSRFVPWNAHIEAWFAAAGRCFACARSDAFSLDLTSSLPLPSPRSVAHRVGGMPSVGAVHIIGAPVEGNDMTMHADFVNCGEETVAIRWSAPYAA